MKPTTITNKSGQKFPLVDYQYQTSTLGNCAGHCAKTSKSLRDISRDYFDGEANHDFLSNVAVFGILIATTAVPIITGVNAVIALVRTLPLL